MVHTPVTYVQGILQVTMGKFEDKLAKDILLGRMSKDKLGNM